MKLFKRLVLCLLPMLLAGCGFLRPPVPPYQPPQMPPLPAEIAEKEPVNLNDRLLRLLSPSQQTEIVPPQKQMPASTPTTPSGNCVGRAGFLAESAHDAAGKIDAEEFRVPASVFILGLLQGDAIHRTGHGAQIAGDAALLAIRITGQDDAAAPARKREWFLVGIFDGIRLAEQVHEHQPQRYQVRPDDIQLMQ